MKQIVSICKNMLSSEKKWFVAGLVGLVWIVIVNAFPSSAIFSLGDTTMPLHTSQRFGEYMEQYQWRGLPYFGIFFFLDSIGLSHGAQLTAYLAIFLFSSYLLTYIALQMLFRKALPITIVAFSFVYAINPYTLSLVMIGDVFSASSLLYVTFPLLISFVRIFFQKPSFQTGSMLVLIAFIASSAFVSPRFLTALSLILSVWILFLFLFRESQFTIRILRSLILLSIAVIVVWAYTIPSVILMLRFGESDAISESVTTFSWRFVEHSRFIVDSLRFPMLDSFGGSFPEWFPYTQWQWTAPIFLGLTLIPIGWIVIGWIFSRNRTGSKENHLFWISVGTLVVVALFSARALPPFSFVNESIFSFPGFGSMASEGTFDIFIPWFLVIIGVSASSFLSKHSRLFALSALMISFSALPFFIGEIHRSVSPVMGEFFKRNAWETASISGLVQIPEVYKEFGNWLAENEKSGSIVQLPYSVRDNVIGWEYIPSIGVFSQNIFDAIWRRETIGANTLYFDNWLFTQTFLSSDENPEWLPTLLGTAHVRYIAVHKDVSNDSLEKLNEKIIYLEKRNEISRVFESELLDVYEIQESQILPKLFISDTPPTLTEKPSIILAEKETISTMKVRDVSCARFTRSCSIELLKEEGNKRLTFTEPFSRHWRAVLLDSKGNKTELRTIRSMGFFLGWEIPPVYSGDKIIIEHAQYQLPKVGLVISLFMLICATMVVVFFWNKNRNSV